LPVANRALSSKSLTADEMFAFVDDLMQIRLPFVERALGTIEQFREAEDRINARSS
jgi:hypothetical protein